MSSDESKSSEQRDRTDESLRLERQQFDGVLAAPRSADEPLVDRTVRRARESADALLTASREQVDHLLEEAANQVAVSSATLTAERVLEDELRRSERALADRTLRRERDENARVLARLLPLERERTDRDLFTERARSDAALSSRDDFLAMVSHDLRSLLGGIVMSAELLAVNPGGSNALADTDNIQRYAARMNRLIGDLVDVVSIEAGKLSVLAVDCEVADVVSEAVGTFVQAARDKGITLTADVAAAPLRVDLDPERILQVLANLITNAMKFTPRGGSIRVHTEQAGEQLRFSIHDSGSGIRADLLEAVFQRFWQAGSDDRRGLGLGLYISRCIIEAHGGRIWAESEPGAGTTISFSLPHAAAGNPVLALVHTM